MTNFGEYSLTYTPSEWGVGSMDPEIKMSISAEATLPQMIDFFESFLRAAGYQFECLSYQTHPEKEPLSFTPNPVDSRNDFWEDDGVSFVGNPWAVTMAGREEEDSIAYIGSGLFGSEGEDHLSFSPPRSCFGSSVVTFS